MADRQRLVWRKRVGEGRFKEVSVHAKLVLAYAARVLPQCTHTVLSHDQLTPPPSRTLLSNLRFIHPPPPWLLCGLFLQPSPPLALPCGRDGDLSVHQERQEDHQRTPGGKENQGSCQGNAANSTLQWWRSKVEEEGRKRGGGRQRREVEEEGRKRVEREGRRVEGERGSRSDIHSETTMLNGRHF